MHQETLLEYYAKAKAIIKDNRDRGTPEFPTGIKFVDELTWGLRPGEIWIVSGKAGGGKTSLALQMARSFADKPDHTVLMLSLEMKGWELVLRMFCEMEGVSYLEMISGRAEIDPAIDASFQRYLAGIDFEIVEAGYTFEEAVEVIKTYYETKKPDVIFLDFIQLIDWKKFGEERVALVEYGRRIKEMANKYGIAFVIVSQLRRLPSGSDFNRPPDLSDLKGSGSLEQMADKVLFIYQQLKTERRYGVEREEKTYYLSLAKNRQGATAVKRVGFDGRFFRFTDLPGVVGDPVASAAVETFGGAVIE